MSGGQETVLFLPHELSTDYLFPAEPLYLKIHGTFMNKKRIAFPR